MRRCLVTFCFALCAVAMAGCSSQAPGAPDSPLAPTPAGAQRLSVESIATSASSAGIEGTRRTGAAPSSSGGPAISASGNQTVINGGTQSVSISADAPFDRVFVFVGGRTLGLLGESGGGIDGYYEVRLPSAQPSATVLLTFPQEIPLTRFDLQFAAASPSGAVGPYVPLSTTVTSVGTGDVQVTLSWDADSDVDLHVTAPGGEEIFYGRRQSGSGGELDLDSNAACEIDGVRNENITWPVGSAPQGVYTVRVDYWNSCGVRETNYTVRINNGGAVQIFGGAFTGPGDEGGVGSGRTIATFERGTGPAARVPTQALTSGSSVPASTKALRSAGPSRQ